MRSLFFIICALWLSAYDLNGYYLTDKDDEGKQSIVEIFERDGVFYAYGFATTDGRVSYDAHNPDAKLRGREMGGVVFLWGLKPDGNEWDGGRIYNYVTGKTYDAKAWFKDENNLKIKASVWGFGKTLDWKRLSDEEVKQYLSTKPTMDKVISTIPAE